MELPPLPQYARAEHERRFLVRRPLDSELGGKPFFKLFEDRYLHGGRLRLRRMTDSDSGRCVYKLTKKYGFSDPGDPHTQPIVTVLLSFDEYRTLSQLPGRALVKRRYYDRCDVAAATYSIDVFSGALCGLVTSEVEAESAEALRALPPPPFADCEVTSDPFFAGGNLCRVAEQELWRYVAERYPCA